MSKSALFGIVFLTALLSFMIWNGYLQLPGNTINVDLSVPEDVDFSFKVDNLESTLDLLNTTKYKNDLQKLAWYRELTTGLKLIQNLTLSENSNTLSIVAAYKYSKNDEGETDSGNFLFCITKENIPQQPFKFFRKIINNTEEIVETNKVGNTTMYSADVTIKDIKKLTFASKKGIILFSEQTQLVEQSLNKLNSISKGFSIGFSSTYPKSNQSIKTIYTGLKLNYPNNLGMFFRPNDFVELEEINTKLYLFNNGVIANGELVVKKNSRFDVLAKHATEDFGKITSYIPGKVTYFEKYKVDNLLDYIAHLLENEAIELSSSTTNLVKCLSNEWLCLKYSENGASNFVFVVEDAVEIEDYLDLNSKKIKSFNNVDLLDVLGLNEDKQEHFYKLSNDVLIIGSNEKTVETIMNDIEQNKNFTTNIVYQQYEPKLYKNSFCLIYNKQINTSFKNNFGPAFYQLFNIDNDIFINAVIGYEAKGLTNQVNFEYKPKITQLETSKGLRKWENIIGQKIINGPEIFKNHHTKENENIVQDNKNNLYLIDKKDSITWKKPLDSKYLGNISMIDFYDNNKNQILLNTKNYIYLIDRKGRDVTGFPVKIIDEATNGLTIVKYADVNKIRYYVANNKNILNAYNKTGKPVKGWELPALTGEVVLPVKHFVANNKDYLCAVTKNGLVYLFSRDGTPRQQPFETNIKNINTVELIVENGNGTLMLSNGKNTQSVVFN